MRFHKTRTTLAESKCEIEMTPTLDIIFQLLIFFILTFKPITDEGQFGVNLSSMIGGSVALPPAVPGMDSEDMPQPDIEFNPPFRVRLISDSAGNIAKGGVVLGDRTLPSLDYLLFELRNTVRGFPEEFEVVIEADPRLHWEHVVQVVNAVSHSGVRKVNFGPAPSTSP